MGVCCVLGWGPRAYSRFVEKRAFRTDDIIADAELEAAGFAAGSAGQRVYSQQLISMQQQQQQHCRQGSESKI